MKEIADIVELLLYFNEDQRREGLKTLTPSQMLSRLLISLAQLIVGNNSEKLENETRQLQHFFVQSKKTYQKH